MKRLLTNRNYILVITASLYAIIYLLISVINHLLFRTYALDLGLFNQAMHAVSHFRPARFTLDITGADLPFFATHFSPVIYLYIPFYWVFGEYSLLLLQVVAVVAGGVGIYIIGTDLTDDRRLSLLIMVFFYSTFGVFSAISFDFHNNVVAAMLLPWFFLFAMRGKSAASLIFFTLILICREDMALWMVFILLGMLLMPRSRINLPGFLILVLMGIALAWFIVATEVILPGLNTETAGQFSRYGRFGDSLGSLLAGLAGHPAEVLRDMFINTTKSAEYDGIKLEFYIMLLLSGGVAVLLRPRYLVMIIPLLMQKMLSNDYALWGINYHYSIGFSVVFAIALADLAATIRLKRGTTLIILFFTLLTITSTISILESRKSKWYRRENSAFYRREHYIRGLDREEIRKGISLIPDNVGLSVCSELAPHLSSRQVMYHFPVVKDAEWIALLKNSDVTYPLTREKYFESLERIRSSIDFSVEFESDDLIIFRRIE